MPIGIVIAVAVVLVIVSAVISHFVTVSNLKKNAESKIGNAESKAREIIDDAVKTAEAKKKESLLEIKEESIKNKNELERESKNADLNYRDMRSVYFPRKKLWINGLRQLRSAKQALQQKKNS